MKADAEASGGLRGEIKVWPSSPGRGGGGTAKVITVKLKGTAVETRLSPRHSSKWSPGASFAYHIVKYCPWHRRNRGVINALNQFKIAPHGVAPLGRRHYRELWWQMRGITLFLRLSVHLRRACVVPVTPVISYFLVRMFFFSPLVFKFLRRNWTPPLAVGHAALLLPARWIMTSGHWRKLPTITLPLLLRQHLKSRTEAFPKGV